MVRVKGPTFKPGKDLRRGPLSQLMDRETHIITSWHMLSTARLGRGSLKSCPTEPSTNSNVPGENQRFKVRLGKGR